MTMTRPTRQLPSKDQLCAIFSYDPITGSLIWKERVFASALANGWNARYANKVAGVKNSEGYLSVSINKRKYLVHRVIWKMLHCEDPLIVDHIDGDRTNNSAANLRHANESLSAFNKKLPSGRLPRGVQPNGSKYMARLAGKHLGTYATPEEAHAVYCATAQQRFNGVPNALQ